MVNDSDLAYCAGFFDGEGSIIIRQIGENHKLQVSIQQNDPDILAFFKDCVCAGNVTTYLSPRGNRIWRWQVAMRGAGHVMRLLLPYLRLKRAEAELAVEFAELIGNHGEKASVENLMSRRNIHARYIQVAHARKAVSYG